MSRRSKTIFIHKKDNTPQHITSSATRKHTNGYITKRVANNKVRIPPRDFLPRIPDIPSHNLPDDVREYIERMRKQERLRKLARVSNDVLFKCHTVFPFDPFKDTLIIDKTKVNFITKMFFFSESVHSIMIRTIKDLQVDTNVFFAKMTIIPDVYMGQTTEISYLRKSDALEARRIIQGLMLCQKEDIDISDLDAQEIKSKIETAGTALEVSYAER